MGHIVLIEGDKKVDDFMHSLDVFESFKVVAWPYEIKINGNEIPDEKVSELKTLLEEENRRVVAIFFKETKKVSYLDESVFTISNGKNFALLNNVLEAYGIEKRVPYPNGEEYNDK